LKSSRIHGGGESGHSGVGDRTGKNQEREFRFASKDLSSTIPSGVGGDKGEIRSGKGREVWGRGSVESVGLSLTEKLAVEGQGRGGVINLGT